MYFDAHSDIWTDVTIRRMHGEKNVFHNHHTKRLKDGNVEGSIFVIWVDPPYTSDYRKRTSEIMSCIQAEAEEAEDICIVHNYDEMVAAKNEDKIYVFIGIEGMAAIGTDVDELDKYYEIGARHGMLTWNEVNDLGSGAVSGKRMLPLSDAGKKAVRYMEEKGMLVDVSHLNEGGFWDVARIAEKPFIASHSNCSALCDVPRNLTDEQLRAIRDADGCVGLNSFNLFISENPADQTVEQLAQHAAHMIDVMGIDHVGCGFDFCDFVSDDIMSTMTNDVTAVTKGLENCRSIHRLFECFDEMGMTAEEKEKIAHLNFQRVIKDVMS